jgi:hypothetical protein
MLEGTALLAHQGGWDEILFVAVPILAVIGLLAVLKRRVERTGPVVGAESDVDPPAPDDVRSTTP